MTNNWCHLRIRICLLILVLGSTSLVRADWIELVNGHKIEGDVLKQSNTHLLVDIGIEVLRIPVEQIRSRTKSEKLPDGKAPTSKSKTIAELPVKSIKELARTYGEAVTLVQTSSGLGSGFIINDRGYCVTNYHVVEKETTHCSYHLSPHEKWGIPTSSD